MKNIVFIFNYNFSTFQKGYGGGSSGGGGYGGSSGGGYGGGGSGGGGIWWKIEFFYHFWDLSFF